MRLPVESSLRLARRAWLIALLPLALGGCGAASGGREDLASLGPPAALVGPAADYPVVVGEPYRVGEKLHTPVDTLNYDEVGYIAADAGMGVSGAHHTLPLPSYAEVTSLETGRTILVRLERRGPMTGDALAGLSQAALAQLGAAAGAPVRLRRVNPPEDDRAMLRSGQSAPLRMDTPESLLTVLKRKLPADSVVALERAPIAGIDVEPSIAAREPEAAPQVAEPRPLPAPALPPLGGQGTPAPASGARQPVVVASLPPSQIAQQPAQVPPRAAPPPQAAVTAPPPQPAPRPVARGGYVVQVAALSSPDRARSIANAIGGRVEQAGQFYRIRTGPFTTRAEAEASLAKVRAAGYSEARIFTNG